MHKGGTEKGVVRGVHIGRLGSNEIVLGEPAVSGTHARLTPQPGQRWLLEDLGSKNGTFVNDRSRPVRSCLLAPEDVVYFGSHGVPAQQLIARALTCLGLPAPQPAAPKPAPHHAGHAGQTFSIGRLPTSSIILDYPSVSRTHARLARAPRGGWTIEDLGSRHGTFVNDRRHPVRGLTPLRQEDTVYFGSYKISAARLVREALSRGSGQAMAQSISLRPGSSITLGRDPGCDIPLDSMQVSWRHARVSATQTDWIIEDLKSRNGTYVNGVRIRKTRLGPGDAVSLGTFEVRLSRDRQVVARALAGDIRIDADDISFVVPTKTAPKTLLDRVSFTIYPSEFVGLMGLSGAGKTLLLMNLLGYLRPTHGRSLFNGRSLYMNYDQYKGMIGYVPQDDIIHGELTVQEALSYAARLRLDSGLPPAEITRRVDASLRLLGLLDEDAGIDLRGIKVNPASEKGISGGQRKRVNLAMELITDPPVLFLDEPTSGLSCVDTIRVMRILRKLADSGKTIIITLHQPDIESYQQLDNVLIMDHGKLVFYGPAWPDSLTFFNPGQPEGEVTHRAESGLLGLSRMPAAEWQQRYAASRHKHTYVEERRSSSIGLEKEGSDRKIRQTRWPFSWRQFSLLTSRNVVLKLKDRVNTGILLAQAPIIATLLGFIFHGQAQMEVPLFLLAISGLWLGTSNAAKEIVSERGIYQRERMLFLGISEYVLSKFCILSAIGLLQALLLSGIAKAFLEHLTTPFPELFGLCLFIIVVGQSLGLLVSSLARTQAAADTLVPLLIIPMVILGGGMIPMHKMQHEAARGMTTIMPSRWAFELLVQAENKAASPEAPATLGANNATGGPKGGPAGAPSPTLAPGPGSPVVTGAGAASPDMDALTQRDIMRLPILQRTFADHAAGSQVCTVALLAMSLLFMGASMAALKSKDSV